MGEELERRSTGSMWHSSGGGGEAVTSARRHRAAREVSNGKLKEAITDAPPGTRSICHTKKQGRRGGRTQRMCGCEAAAA